MYDRIRVSNDNLLFVFFMSLDEISCVFGKIKDYRIFPYKLNK